MNRFAFFFQEKLLFYLFIIWNLTPLFGHSFVPTMDGPAHLYNSQIIQQLLFGDNSFLHHYFELNSVIVPNWFGHFLLMLLNSFLSPSLAEKIHCILFLVAFPLSFRYLLRSLNSESKWLGYFSLPFCYSFMFLSGFFNFSFALIFFCLTLGFWFKNKAKNQLSLKFYVGLFTLSTLTFFSHGFVFSLLLFILGVHFVYTFTGIIFEKKTENTSKINISEIKNGVFILLSWTIPLILFGIYFFSFPSGTQSEFIPNEELWKHLTSIQSLIVFNVEIESLYTNRIFYVLIGLILTSIFLIFYRKKWKNWNKKAFFWWGLSLLFLLFYFLLPNSDGVAGYISIRLSFFFSLILILSLSFSKIPSWILVLGVGIVMHCNNKLNNYYSDVFDHQDEIAKNVFTTSKFIEPNSVILPVNCSSNWLVGHYSNYLGAEKPIAILENYEANTPYFPVKWNAKLNREELQTKIEISDKNCAIWMNEPLSYFHPSVDYVFLLTDSKVELPSLENKNSKLELIHQNEHCVLLKINKLTIHS